MQTQVKWIENQRFVGTTPSCNAVVMDADRQQGCAPSPMEMILIGLGGCASVDVVSILQKARQAVVSCHVDIDAERAEAVPAVYTKVHLNFVVKGNNIKVTQVKRAVSLSAEKYCSVSSMLEKGGVEITHSFEVIDTE